MTTQTTTTAPSVALDIVYGPRDTPAHCSVCDRPIPATDGKPVFDLETADGDPLCAPCSDRHHRGLRLVCLVMGYIVEAYGTGNRLAAEETIRGFQSAVELLDETAPKTPYRPPIRRQPRRIPRSRRR